MMNKLSLNLLHPNKRFLLNNTERLAVCIFYSTKPAVKRDQNEEIPEKIKQTERITHLFRKPHVKKPQKPPFAKNLFVGNFDPDILTYPQLEKDELENLENSLKPVADFFKSKEAGETKNFSDKFVDKLKSLYLFGLRAPVTAGGRELTHTEYCKFGEIIAGHELGCSLRYSEQFGIQALLKNGSDELKAKYLPRLISGELLSAFCIHEENNNDDKDVRTRAERNPDGSWTLNGQKTWVVNGSIADLLVVIAESDMVYKDTIRESLTTAFLVEKKFGGITTQRCNTLLDSDISDVYFNNTLIPAGNVLGEEICSTNVIASILTEARLNIGPACVTLNKELLKKFTEHCKNGYVNGISLIESDSVVTKLANLIGAVYAMESVTYLTSLLLDQYENQDCEIEAAIVKVFCSEQSVLASLQCLDFIGTPALVKDHWLNKIHREALGFSFLTESNEKLKLIISLLGIQHAGGVLHERIKKMRNPFFHPWEAVKYSFRQMRHNEDNPRLNLKLSVNVHPSIFDAVTALEYCVLRLQFATETLLLQHGIEVVNDHQNLQRLAESVIDIFAMTACVGRASRSYCIGLRHADMELMAATSFCMKAKERVRQNVQRIYRGPYTTEDQSKQAIADNAAKWNGYFLEHPLARNF